MFGSLEFSKRSLLGPEDRGHVRALLHPLPGYQAHRVSFTFPVDGGSLGPDTQVVVSQLSSETQIKYRKEILDKNKNTAIKNVKYFHCFI